MITGVLPGPTQAGLPEEYTWTTGCQNDVSVALLTAAVISIVELVPR